MSRKAKARVPDYAWGAEPKEYILDVIARFACEHSLDGKKCGWSCWTCDVRIGWEIALADRFPQTELELA